jgi:predicted protein tyrosine phosphatase
MQITVSDRYEIEAGLLVKTAYIVISIRDPKRRKAQVRRQSGLQAVLDVAFHDAEPTQLKRPPGIVVMTDRQAKEIWEFILRHAELVGTIVVHCEQGMSRSPAVAAAIARWFQQDESHFFNTFQPNKHVYELMKKHQPSTPPPASSRPSG